jgi:hypothetical protein
VLSTDRYRLFSQSEKPPLTLRRSVRLCCCATGLSVLVWRVPNSGSCIGIEVAVFPNIVLTLRCFTMDRQRVLLVSQGGGARYWHKRGERMYQGSQRNETANSSNDTLALVQWLVTFCQFVHECRACQYDVAPHWQLCAHCDVWLAISCLQCTDPLPPAGAYACPCCGFAMPPVETWAKGVLVQASERGATAW